MASSFIVTRETKSGFGRPNEKVFQGVTEDSTYRAMVRACKLAGVPHYHPHDLCGTDG